jgi:hypothetical protein
MVVSGEVSMLYPIVSVVGRRNQSKPCSDEFQ